MRKTLGLIALLAAFAAPALPTTATAQNRFAPVIEVNDKVITGWELAQRERMLTALNAPGSVPTQAREQLIEDRLKLDAAERAGIAVSEEEVLQGMTEFASRAELSREEFVQALAQAGVAEQTFRDFVRSGVAWREVVRQRFQGRAQVSDDEVERALASASGGSNVRVLLSEIIMAAPPNRAAEVRARAEQIAQYRSEAEFSRAARQYSATATRGAGGRLPWQNLTDIAPQLRPLVVGLAPGEVTEPIPIPGAIALFQLRAIEETDYTRPEIAAVEYAVYLLSGGRTEQTLREAERISQTVDVCDDLYGVAKGKPEELLQRQTQKPAEVPQDVAMELQKLDAGEVSYGLTRPTSQGAALMLVMLCGRTPVLTQDADRDQVTLGLRNQRLSRYADSYLAQLKADARIVER